MRRPIPYTVRSSTKLGQRSDLVNSKPTFSLSAKAFSPRQRSWYTTLRIHLNSWDTPTITGYSRLCNPAYTTRTLRSPSKLDRVHICTISGAIPKNMTKKGRWNLDTQKSGKLPQSYAWDLQGFLRHRERMVEFEDAPNRDEGRVEGNSEGERPSEQRAEDNTQQRVNLAPLLAAHLGSSESGQSLQSSLTLIHGGHQPSFNSGGNLPPNSMHLSHNAQPFIPNSLQPSIGPTLTYVNP
ncbi:hypothetical protein Tco_0551980 [Tanacetum coccineum]